MGENSSASASVPIPDRLWELIPKSGQYIKSIMDFCGYVDVESAVRLKEPEELKKMFRFAADMVEVVPNKKELFGVFAPNPEKLCILPGIQEPFNHFLTEVGKLTPESAAPNNTIKPSNRKRPSNRVSITLDDIKNQMEDWLREKGINRLFRITTVPNVASKYTYTCLHCHWKTVLLIHGDEICLTHAQRHINHHCIVSIVVPESDLSRGHVGWNSRQFRSQRKQYNESMKPGQTAITEYFDVNTFTSSIDDVVYVRKKVNEIGAKESVTVKPILNIMYSNALKNAKASSKAGNRHEKTIKTFASYLFCLIGRPGYEFLLGNIGGALPSLSTISRSIGENARINEGQFLFDELENHLNKWNAPKFIHIHMDDTRVLNKVEYDPATDRFVGFVLPLEDGLPEEEAFVLATFEELKHVYETTPVAKYAHCIVAKPVTCDAPSFVFFVLGTDSKYDHSIILQRWKHVETELNKRKITVVSFGADGAGSFLKAMLVESGLFYPSNELFAKSYAMKAIKKHGLVAQDTVHLLAKLRTRLLIPSNILVLGNETACRAHITHVYNNFPKEQHGLTERIVSNKDKQNYSGIETLISDGVLDCLNNSKGTMENNGTIIYLTLMRNIRDCFFDKSLKPATRLCLIWKVVFFLRIWRRWLKDNERPEKDHFVTNNVYVCIEINAHLILQMIHGVMKGDLPKEAMRVWHTGSQGCEEVFRLLRSMTSTFSTIINFSVKGILERIHKLNFLSSMECSDNIAFPRVQKRLLQCKEEGEETFQLCEPDEVDNLIEAAKAEAVQLASTCGMELESYEDSYVLSDFVHVLANAVDEDEEDEEYAEEIDSTSAVVEVDPIVVQEDLANLRLTKSSNSGLPVYDVAANTKGTIKSKTYSFQNKKRCPFISYGDKYIRKSTALYLLQEKFSLSNDRLLRVRVQQPSHIHCSGNNLIYPVNHVKSCDLCMFKRVDNENKIAIGRIIQFSYLLGTKKSREFSGDFVDLEKDITDIGAFCNWYQGEDEQMTIGFTPSHVYAQGYIPLENYVMKIPDNQLHVGEGYAFLITKEYLDSNIDDCAKVL